MNRHSTLDRIAPLAIGGVIALIIAVLVGHFLLDTLGSIDIQALTQPR